MVDGSFGHCESSMTVPGGRDIETLPLSETASSLNMEHLITRRLADDDHLNRVFSLRPPWACGVWYRPMSTWSRVSVSAEGVDQARPPAGRSEIPVLQDSNRLSEMTPPTV